MSIRWPHFIARRLDRSGNSRAPGRDGKMTTRTILTWALAVSLTVGVLELAQPVDGYLRMARNTLNLKRPSGEIVVVGIDDRSVEAIGAWPWARSHHVDLLNRLAAAGAVSARQPGSEGLNTGVNACHAQGHGV